MSHSIDSPGVGYRDDYASVSALIKRFPSLEASEDTVRWWIFNADQNGLASAILRVGRRVYIKVPQFIEWLESRSK